MNIKLWGILIKDNNIKRERDNLRTCVTVLLLFCWVAAVVAASLRPAHIVTGQCATVTNIFPLFNFIYTDDDDAQIIWWQCTTNSLEVATEMTCPSSIDSRAYFYIPKKWVPLHSYVYGFIFFYIFIYNIYICVYTCQLLGICAYIA